MGRLRTLLERQTLDHDPLAAVLFGHLWDGAPLDGLVLSNTKNRHHDYGNVCSVIANNVYTDIKREDEQRRGGGAKDGGKTKKMFDKIKQNRRWIIRETSLLLNFSV